MSNYLDFDMAARAITMMVPSIEHGLANHAKRFAGHIRVSSYANGEWMSLATRDFGDREQWEHDYEGHATAKELISQRTGKSTREVQLMHPELLEIGDTVYYGSVVSDDGKIVVAFSGVEAFFDEMFAKCVLAVCLALIQQRLQHQVDAGKEYFTL